MSLAIVCPVPNPSRRATPPRTAQIEDEYWLPALKIAKIRGETMSKVMRAAVIRYVARHRHLLEGDKVK